MLQFSHLLNLSQFVRIILRALLTERLVQIPRTLFDCHLHRFTHIIANNSLQVRSVHVNAQERDQRDPIIAFPWPRMCRRRLISTPCWVQIVLPRATCLFPIQYFNEITRSNLRWWIIFWLSICPIRSGRKRSHWPISIRLKEGQSIAGPLPRQRVPV